MIGSVDLLLTALQSLAPISRQNCLPQNPLKYPYFAINKHQIFITYIDTNGRSHYAHSAMPPVLELHPSNQWDFNWADKIGLNNTAIGKRPI
jgi:hypothetical protein